MKSSGKRVFIGLHEIGGFYYNLHSGFMEAECRPRLVTLTRHPFGYAEAPCGWIDNLVRWWLRKACNIEGEQWPQFMPHWLSQAIGHSIVLLVALTHDVFIFSCGVTFADALGTEQIFWLKLFRRKVAVIFHGSDSRAPWCDRTGYTEDGRPVSGSELLELIRTRKAKVQRAHEIADVVMDWPLSGHFHTKRFLSRLTFGTPTNMVSIPASVQQESNSEAPVRILHCPSDFGIKGTAEIRRVIQLLRQEGWNMEFKELSGVTNHQVLDELTRCDFVIDQLFSDIPMASFAREAAILGKAAIVGGYAWDDLRQYLPREQWPPTLLCHPDGLEACLRKLLQEGSAKWHEIGRQAQEFVRVRWAPADCAERLLLSLYSPDQVNSWIDPKTCRYLWGCGLHALESLELDQTIMQIAETEGFCLEDKPELLAKHAALGSINVMSDQRDLPPVLAAMDEHLWSITRSLVERNVEMQKQNLELKQTITELIARIGHLEEVALADRLQTDEQVKGTSGNLMFT